LNAAENLVAALDGRLTRNVVNRDVLRN
jgi:gluconate 2-dehydrogenase